MAKIIDGFKIAEKITKTVRRELSAEKTKPQLAGILVGKNKAADAYASFIGRKCREAGMKFSLFPFPSETSKEKLVAQIKKLNRAKKISGIILFLPLPGQIKKSEIQESINPLKDAEGIHPENLGRLMRGTPYLIPSTAAAVAKILEVTIGNLAGKEITIIGCSEIFGRPLSLLLLNRLATVSVCHIKTRNIASHTRRADILISATGKRNLIKSDMIKKGAVVIDVGFNVRGNKIRGDVDFGEVSKKASFITPVPGGVGPVTTAMLLSNVLKAWKTQKYQRIVPQNLTKSRSPLA
ncbi:MAG: bifunctional 5,10-methylenetetrahydrofolate dehydrogenase/5,10-methenyltetrahydrofolate cyclohydrolase [Elusimicrobia bacterium]|nr:bifunctional 5,10-methylenetetrahydrofolate dehydrogenase/5,10-methenyltetrahydrofolate cyclohydrolase [Elusimicrobiota bacterium]